jgi:hypothetical protein
MIFALVTVALITPRGRAFAQNVLQFFTRAERNSFPVPVQDTVPDDATALPLAPSLMNIEEAEAQARFDLAELPFVPEGFRYLGAGWQDWSSIAIQYEAVNGGGALTLTQSKVGYSQSEWAEVPAEAIVPVKINDLTGEFVQGTFIVRPGESTATWNPSVPMLRVRWVKDGIFFQLTKFGDVESIEYLDQAGMIALAESVTTNPFPLVVKDAEVQAGFDVLEPSRLPAGMTFLGSSFDPVSKLVSLSFGYSETDRRILIKQQPVNFTDTCDLCGVVGASASVESVQIGDAAGEYARGVWELTENGPVWRDDPYLTTIRWQRDGMAFELISLGIEVGKEEFLAMSASMK